ncbi:hypothetical protein L2D14_01535 [Thalassospiraceae bacterium LMO-JJ14]|nr:hypothetical protein L2D14_01535 [Thalassospiraceae bacterium LMO-JJ14]
MGTTDNAAADTAVRNLQTASAARAERASGTNLAGSVGIGGENAPKDVTKVSSALAANGLMDAPQAHADATLFKGIIGAQERMDSTLKRDGVVNPGGPTERAFSRLAGQGFVKQPSTPPPATGDAALNAKLRADAKHDAVAAAEARIKANLSDETRSDYRKAQDRDRLEKAREDARRADARARHEQAERARRLEEKRAAGARKAAADAKQASAEYRQRAQRGLTLLVEKAGDVLESALGEMTRDYGAERNPEMAQADAPSLASRPGSIRAATDPGSEDEKPVPDDPSQDDPDEPNETPDDPGQNDHGQDDPEDPCARYEQAVADAEDEVEALEARADELEREINDLANQVMELERQKQQILDILRGMRTYYFGAGMHPSLVITGIDAFFGPDKKEYLRDRNQLLADLTKLRGEVANIRSIMQLKVDAYRESIADLAEANRMLAQARADLAKCQRT